MKLHLFILLTIILTACGSTSTNKSNSEIQTNKVDSTITLQENQSEYTTEASYATYFVLVADTNQDYYILHKKMLDLNRKLNIPIDTMGRFYNKTKNLIALPDNDEDEIYAGDYFPRRFPSANLSLEYLGLYQKQAGENTIALVTGIYETENSADSALSVLYQTEKKAFKIKANIYAGCMH